jgi:hypothetical protein
MMMGWNVHMSLIGNMKTIEYDERLVDGLDWTNNT